MHNNKPSGPVRKKCSSAPAALEELLALVAAMRDPSTGEPWAIRQDMAGIVPYTIEESYEVAEAIDHGDISAIRSELGDLLLQVVFYAQIASEHGWFDFYQVADELKGKLQSRQHSGIVDSAKQKQSASKTSGKVLAGVSHAMPAVRRAEKLQKMAAAVGFDWDGTLAVADKLQEELQELRCELEAGSMGITAARDELGDMLFVCVNLARHLDSDTETILRAANRKFERRFGVMEQQLVAEGGSIAEASMEQMERAWQKAKDKERQSSD